MERLGAPDQGVDPKAQLVVGPIGGDQTNSCMSLSEILNPCFVGMLAAVSNAGFIAQDLMFRNMVGLVAHQAMALRVDSDRSAFFRMAVEGH